MNLWSSSAVFRVCFIKHSSIFLSFNKEKHERKIFMILLFGKKLWRGNDGKEAFPCQSHCRWGFFLPLIFLFILKLLYLETEYRLKCDSVENRRKEWIKISFLLLLSFLLRDFKIYSKQPTIIAHVSCLYCSLLLVIYIVSYALYTFIFPIIILLSFTRRWELYVRP